VEDGGDTLEEAVEKEEKEKLADGGQGERWRREKRETPLSRLSFDASNEELQAPGMQCAVFY